MSWLSNLLGGGDTAATSTSAHELVSAGATLLDVRSDAEFRGGHIEGAKNIPVQVLAARMRELDLTKPIVVYCRSGARSRSAAGALRQAGATEVLDLGPMRAW